MACGFVTCKYYSPIALKYVHIVHFYGSLQSSGFVKLDNVVLFFCHKTVFMFCAFFVVILCLVLKRVKKLGEESDHV